jgi:hypothetical protein
VTRHGGWWRRFRARPWWYQALLWVVLTPAPLFGLAAARRRRGWWGWWALAAFLTVVWLGVSWFAVFFVSPHRLQILMGEPAVWVQGGLVVGVGLAFLRAIAVVLPARLVPPEELTREQLLKARHDVRSSLFAAFGGAVALGGAFAGGYVGLRQLDVGLRQVDVSREGQITERFTRAIDQLGSQSLDVRVGGIYALDRIGRDSETDYRPIMEVLTAFLRQHARPPKDAPPKELILPPHAENTSPGEFRVRPPADLEAALAVVGRPVRWYWLAEDLDLQEIYMVGASLQDANLRAADLTRANLQSADLRHADLAGASLAGANLRHALLSVTGRPERHMRARTNLSGADLRGADLTGADLTGADLTGAALDDAILDGARADGETKWPEGFDPQAHGVDVW